MPPAESGRCDDHRQTLAAVFHALKFCKDLTPVLDDAELTTSIEAAFSLCLERYCDSQRAALQTVIDAEAAATPERKRAGGH